MARARRSFRRFSQARTPNLEWSDMNDAQTSVVAGTKTLLFSLTPTVAVDVTILRTRILMLIRSDQKVAPEDQKGALGMILVSNEAVAAGAASIPGPVSDASADWFLYQPFTQALQFTTAAGLTTAGTDGVQYDIDSKSKRILQGTDQSVAVMIEPHSDSEGFIVDLMGRILTRVRGTG